MPRRSRPTSGGRPVNNLQARNLDHEPRSERQLDPPAEQTRAEQTPAAPARQAREAQDKPRRPWWLNKKVMAFLAVCGVAAAACLIVPQMARSASLERDLRQQLSAVASARNALEQELAEAKAELVDAAGQIQSAEADVAAHELKVGAGEQFIDQLTEQLEASQQANVQTLAQLEAAEQAGDEARAEAVEFGHRARPCPVSWRPFRRTPGSCERRDWAARPPTPGFPRN